MTTGTQPVWNRDISAVSLQVSESDGLDMDELTAEDNHQALSQFSDISRKFIDSYSHLEKHIDHLSHELAAQTAEKEQQFDEKNRLAERLEKILSTLPSAIVVIDGHGKVQESNALATDMLGSPIIGETWMNIISRSFAPRSDDGHEISLKDGRRVKVETKALGSEPGQIILLTDLTETRKLQEHQSREQRLSVIGKMMASLAHQIRTPLSSALLYSGHISSQKLNEERQQRFHMNLQHSLKQLERQVSDMLLFASGGVASKERFELESLVKAIKLDLSSNIEMKDTDINIVTNLSEEDLSELTLFGNMQALLGAIANLVENSLRACKDNESKGNLVDISIDIEYLNNEQLSISISDNGCGIPSNDKAQVLKPFFTSHARGTGLGLAVVQTVMNSFKGTININSTVGRGTVIHLLIPCIQSGSFLVNKQQLAGS